VTESCDKYLLYENIGVIQERPWHEIPFDIIKVSQTTRAVCRQLCSTTYDLICSGFLYDRRRQSCELSPYTGENVPPSSPKVNRSYGLEFYRRKRCVGETLLFLFFDICILILLWWNSSSDFEFFTAYRARLCCTRSAVSPWQVVCLSVRLSVTLRHRGHIGRNT